MKIIKPKLAFVFDKSILTKNVCFDVDDYLPTKLCHDLLWRFFHKLILAVEKDRNLSYSELLGIKINENKYWRFNSKEYSLREQNSWELLQDNFYYFYSLHDFLLDPINFWYDEQYFKGKFYFYNGLYQSERMILTCSDNVGISIVNPSSIVNIISKFT